MRLRYFGDPVLRKKAEPVTEITDEIRELAEQMLIQMEECDNAIGIAATQLGLMLRMFATMVYTDLEDGEPNYGKPRVFINPIISNPSIEMVEMNEACLSLPKMYAPVLRPFSIDFEAMDIEGNVIKERNEGFLARHRMHETDHLNGVLYIDRIKGKKRTELEPYLRRIKKEYS